MEDKDYLIVITQGREDGGNSANLAMKLAVSLQLLQRNVSVFLTLGGTRWAFEGTAKDIQFPDQPPLEEFIQDFLDMGGDLMICSPCIDAYCFIPNMEKEKFDEKLREGARYVGLAAVAEKLIKGQASFF